MNIFVFISCITIPILMILIGTLYKFNLYKRINKVSTLFVPLIMFFTGISEARNESIDLNINKNKICSLIWIILGSIILILISILLLFNKNSFYNIMNSLLELECIIFAIIFVSVRYFIKK
ncbi:hypothetical protein [Clostridium sardiniense]|uniref:hypothetical protein n=1 Tax=Clostridium sardiniense TaxID=29369 RepID=UPI00195A9313|nr:hypothetical protein [Clostridium sardiniense]MBM7836351.1 uncharacterized membrane protein YbjE (DUF340 family) [Clostridium sardiniense]